MDSATQRAGQQTPAQWAVRWHGVVFAALLLAAVPVFHLGWHVLGGHEKPPIITRSQTDWPPMSWDAVLDGSWMEDAERHLREASPVVWLLRGAWKETMLRFGILLDDQVHLGRDRWMFYRSTLGPSLPQFERQAEARRRFFGEVRDLVRGSGAELLVSLVPDKARIYPEFAFADGVLSAGMAPVYGLLLDELRDLDIAVVDVAAALTAARAAQPDHPVFYARDTHWRPRGALAAGQAVAARLESLPVAANLTPRRPTELGARRELGALGDLTSILGLLTCELPWIGDRTRCQPLSLLSAELIERRDYYDVWLIEGSERSNPLVDDPAAEVLLLGTSFSESNGAGALALALGRPVRVISELGASGLRPLRRVVDELRQGTRAKVVIWELVERGLLEIDYEQVKL